MKIYSTKIRYSGVNIRYSGFIAALSIAYSLVRVLFKVLFLLTLLGLFLHLVPDEFFERPSDSGLRGMGLTMILWFRINSPFLMAILLAFLIKQTLQSVNQIKKEQLSQSMVLGGLANYFELVEPQLPIDRNPQKYSREVNLETIFKDWLNDNIVDSNITRIENGIDPFETKFKRGSEFPTMREDFPKN